MFYQACRFFCKTIFFMLLPKNKAASRYSLLLLENQILKRSLDQHNINPDFNNFDRSVYLTNLKFHPGLKRFVTLVKPETIVYVWSKRLQKYWTHLRKIKKKGRHPISNKIKKLILEILKDNYSWGYDRIVGAFMNLSFDVSRDTVRRTIQTSRKSGLIEPSGSWKRFLTSHWGSLFACDFFILYSRYFWLQTFLYLFHS